MSKLTSEQLKAYRKALRAASSFALYNVYPKEERAKIWAQHQTNKNLEHKKASQMIQNIKDQISAIEAKIEKYESLL